MPSPNRSGLCRCGCGEPTQLETHTNLAEGRIAGVPRAYVSGHYARTPAGKKVFQAGKAKADANRKRRRIAGRSKGGGTRRAQFAVKKIEGRMKRR